MTQPRDTAINVEDWSEGDFELDDQALTGLTSEQQYDRPSWGELHLDLSGTDDDEQTDTIKLSSAAGSALQQLIGASKSTRLKCNTSLQLDDFDNSELDSLFQNEDHDDEVADAARPRSASLSASTSTSYTSMLGLSTDMTEPDTPSSKGDSSKMSDFARSMSGRSPISENQDDDDNMDSAFESTTALDNLRLCPSLSKLRSQAADNSTEQDPWSEETSLSSKSAIIDLSPNRSSTDSLYERSLSEESDADDEYEDILDGIDLKGSIFECSQPHDGIQGRLDAILDLKRSGQTHPDTQKVGQIEDAEADLATGLVITDDLDLSPGRLSYKAMSSQTRISHAHTSAQRQVSLPATRSRLAVLPTQIRNHDAVPTEFHKLSIQNVQETKSDCKTNAWGMGQVHDSQLRRKRSLPSLKPSVTQISQHREAGSDSHSRAKYPASRLTCSTAASRARAAETAATLLARTSQLAQRNPAQIRSRFMQTDSLRATGVSASTTPRVFKRTALYGDGRELIEIDDLLATASPSTRCGARPASSRRTGSNESSISLPPHRRTRNKAQNKPGLIRPLGVLNTMPKGDKEMHWNSRRLRWDGNEGVLRDFDQVVQSSTRPALISQLIGGSTSPAVASSPGYTSPLSRESNALLQSNASGVRVVGDMLFDPIQMRWIHKTGAQEEDVFAHIDEEEKFGESKGHDLFKFGFEGNDTVHTRRMKSVEGLHRTTDQAAQHAETLLGTGPPEAHEQTNWDHKDHAIRRALIRGTFSNGLDIDRELWDACIHAERRHKADVHGFFPQEQILNRRSALRSDVSERNSTMADIQQPRPHLYYLAKIAKSISRP